jgi:heme/copper-type cytochrome/quinol oxidase subunit 1
VAGLGTILGAVNFITTIVCLRARALALDASMDVKRFRGPFPRSWSVS